MTSLGGVMKGPGTRSLIPALVMALGLLAGVPEAQQDQDTTRPTMEQVREQINAQMGMMGPTIYYNALIKKGFTEDQALSIVASVGIPLAGAGR